jgi:hypothetical protein
LSSISATHAYSEKVLLLRIAVGLLLVALGAPLAAVAATPIQLSIHNGRVSLHASDATIAEILAEWARVGHTHIVNGEQVPGGRVTLELTNVPEREALDLLLRTAAGYIAAARTVASDDGSQFDRILILPTSAAPPANGLASSAAAPASIYRQPSPASASRTFLPPGVQRAVGADGQPIPDDQDDAPQPYVPLPPGFDEPNPPPPAAFAPAAPAVPAKSTPTGVPVPGMIVPAAPTQPPPREVTPLHQP